MDFDRLVLTLDYVSPAWDWWSEDPLDSYAVQWTVYLSQVCGMPFDYLYTWASTIRGPYCGALAADLEPLTQEALEAVRGSHKLSELALRKLDRVRHMLCCIPSDLTPAHDWLRLLSTVHYFLHFGYRPLKETSGCHHSLTLKRLTEALGETATSHYDTAWTTLMNLGLTRAKVLPCDQTSEAEIHETREEVVR